MALTFTGTLSRNHSPQAGWFGRPCLFDRQTKPELPKPASPAIVPGLPRRQLDCSMSNGMESKLTRMQPAHTPDPRTRRWHPKSRTPRTETPPTPESHQQFPPPPPLPRFKKFLPPPHPSTSMWNHRDINTCDADRHPRPSAPHTSQFMGTPPMSACSPILVMLQIKTECGTQNNIPPPTCSPPSQEHLPPPRPPTGHSPEGHPASAPPHELDTLSSPVSSRRRL